MSRRVPLLIPVHSSTTQWRTPRPKRRGIKGSPLSEGRAGSQPAVLADAPHVPFTEEPASLARQPSAGTRRTQVLSDKSAHVGTLARSGLTQFFQRGIGSVEWLVFDIAERFRMGYVGTSVSNLAHLVGLRQPDHASLHWPYPPIRPGLPRQLDSSIFGLKEDLDIAQDINNFPSEPVRDALVEAYLTKINPGFPVIDETKFRDQYADAEKPPPVLLLQAVMLAGAHVCDHPQVAESRAILKGILFRRASMLFHLRHESDRMWLIQAALLFTWHLEDADTVSGGSYYWLGLAHRIGFGMGMHRDLSISAVSLVPEYEKRIMRRLWWTAFQWEIFSALEHGRPSAINIDDFDQPLLEPADFIEKNENEPNDNLEFIFCLRNIELCFIILDILKLNSPNPNTRVNMISVNARLARWAMETCEVYPEYAFGDNFWCCQLRMHYNLALLHLHRNFIVPEMGVHEGQDSQSICNDAADAILACLSTISSLGAISQCHFTATMALTSAGIYMSNNIKVALRKGSYLVALGGLDRLTRLLHCARELATFWPNADAVYNMFDGIRKEFDANVMQGIKSEGDEKNAVSPTDLSPDWQAALGALGFMDPVQIDVNGQDWMSMTF